MCIRDRSDGFYRRQLVLTTKEKPAGRIDDPDLAEKMKAEVEGILLWLSLIHIYSFSSRSLTQFILDSFCLIMPLHRESRFSEGWVLNHSRNCLLYTSRCV